LRVLIEKIVWHLDVGSSHPGGAQASKGLAVRQLKRYVSWVKNVVRQFGPYLLYGWDNKCEDFSTRGPSITNQWCIDCYNNI